MRLAQKRLLQVALPLLVVIGLLTLPGASAARAATVSDPIEEAITASAAAGPDWRPGPQRYGVKQQPNVPVTMPDGTVLRATINYPADPRTGRIAGGRFPTLLTITPYGAAIPVSATGANPYFVRRGYLDISVDVRGTGTSDGDFDLFSPNQVADGVRLVHWAAGLAHSDGNVGMHGASYLGINQLLTAAAVGKDSPLKAIFPIVAGNDLYRDTAFMGGIPDFSFDSAYFAGVVPGVNIADPIVSAVRDPAHVTEAVGAELHRATQLPAHDARFLAEAELGGANAYDNAYWQARAPVHVLDDVVANNVPAYLVGGHYDLFQRGEPMNYAGLQNAFAGRPVTAPMDPDQHTTGRYQLLMGPYTHLSGAANSMLDALQLRWFDQWLKGEDTGMDRTPTPLHVYDLGTSHYAATGHYPYRHATPTTFYLGGGSPGPLPGGTELTGAIALPSDTGAATGGTLGADRPPAGGGADTVIWSPAGANTCSRPTDQWTAGIPTLVTNQLPVTVPCLDDDRLGQLGPTAHTYTSAALDTARTIAGPISATLYARATTRETQWVVQVQDVAPDGRSTPLTEGALLGSLRATDRDRSWTVDGRTVMPYHPYTRASASPVTPGKLTRYDIEVFPTYATVEPGHRIRVTLATTDFPHLLPTVPTLATLAGGVYQVQHSASGPSSITIPLR